ncbi:hypothetical protein B0H19DRAFT_392858 [Mycena capillaripes]|nr:hypothetical protein B0H19DRAFT_392858 [Mycena capillaripes]
MFRILRLCPFSFPTPPRHTCALPTSLNSIRSPGYSTIGAFLATSYNSLVFTDDFPRFCPGRVPAISKIFVPPRGSFCKLLTEETSGATPSKMSSSPLRSIRLLPRPPLLPSFSAEDDAITATDIPWPALALPYSFALNIRFCSLACEYFALRTVPSAVKAAPALPTPFPGLQHHSTLPTALPYLEGTRVRPLYKPRHVTDAWNDFFHACRAQPAGSPPLSPSVTPGAQVSNPDLDAWMKVAEELCAGARRYRLKKEEVIVANHAALQSIAHNLGLSLPRLVMRSSILVREINTFARDLELLVGDVWSRIRPAVLDELIKRVSFDGLPLPCAFCPTTSARSRTYTEEALHLHITRSHREHVAPPIEIPGRHRCTVCPSNNTTYDRPSLLRHVENKHGI